MLHRSLLLLMVAVLVSLAPATSIAVTIWADQGTDIVRYDYDVVADTVTQVSSFTPPSTINIDDTWTGLAYSPERETLFVLDGAGTNIILELGLDGSLVNSLGTFGAASLSGLGYLDPILLANRVSGATMVSINPDSGASVAFGGGAGNGGVAAGVGRIFVSTGGSGGNIIELAAGDGSEVNRFTPGVAGYGLAFDGTDLFLGSGDTIYRLDPDTGALLGSASIGSGISVYALAVLERQVVPEPGTASLVAIGLSMVALTRRSRRS